MSEEEVVKDMNDPGFWDDENLEELGEPVGSALPEEPLPDEDGHEREDDQEEVTPDTEEEDVAPQLKDLDTAKKSYNEARAWGNKLQMENQQLAERLKALEEADDDDWEVDTFDPDQFNSLSDRNPIQAFGYAMEQGSHDEALQAVAQVTADSNEWAARAQQARLDEDAEEYQQYAEMSRNAAAQAEQMRAQHAQVIHEEQLAPIRAREIRSDMEVAGTRVRAKHSDAAEYAQPIAAIINEVPGLMGDGSVEAMERGFERAYKMAKADAGGDATDIEALVAAKVKEALGGARKTKAKNAAAAQGTGSGRVDNSAAGGLSEEEQVRQSLLGPEDKSGPIGLNKFWNL